MIGRLPMALTVGNCRWDIRTDFRDILTICEALEDPELNDAERAEVMLTILYPDFTKMAREDYEEAIKQAEWFLDCGREYTGKKAAKVFDWKQDEQLIFPAINKAAGREVRTLDYLHWWSFCGYFMEIGDGTFSVVLGIRQKRSSGKKLEKWEQEFYRKNRELCELKKRYTAEEQAEIDYWNKLLG